MARNRLEIEVAGDVRQLNKDFQQVDRVVDSTMGNIRTKAGQVSVALASMAGAGAGLAGMMVAKAGEMQKYEVMLSAMMGSTKAAHAELQRLTAFAASTPFELPGVVEASIRMRGLGVDVERFLPQAGSLTTVLGTDLPQAAKGYAQALKGVPEGLEMLRNAGITQEKLVAAGAAMNKGQLSTVAADLPKLQAAIEKVVKSSFGDQMAAQSKTFVGAVSNLKDSVGQGFAELGNEMLPMAETGVRALTSLTDSMRNMSPATKGMAADTLLAVTAAAGLASIGMGLVAVIGPLALAMRAYNAVAAQNAAVNLASANTAALSAAAKFTEASAAQAQAVANVEAAVALQAEAIAETEAAAAAELLAVAQGEAAVASQALAVAAGETAAASGALAVAEGGAAAAAGGMGAGALASAAALGPLVVVILAVAGAVGYLISRYSEETKAQAEVIDMQTKAIQKFHEYRGALIAVNTALKDNKSVKEAAADVKAAGYDDVAIHAAIAAKLVEQMEAEKQGDKVSVERIERQLVMLRGVQTELAGTRFEHDRVAAAAKAAAEAQEAAARKALEGFKKNQSAGTFVNPKDELSALDSVMSALKATSKEYEELQLERVKLARNVAEAERKERLAVAQFEFDMLGAKREVDKNAQLKILKDVLDGYQLTTEERRRYTLDAAKLELDIANDVAAKKKKLHEEAVKQAQIEADSRIKAQEAAQKTSELDIKELEDRLKLGQDVIAQLGQEIAERTKLAAEIIKEKAAKEAIDKSPSEAAEIRKTAEVEAQNAIRQGREQVQKMERDHTEKRVKDEAAYAEVAAKFGRAQEDSLQKKFELSGKGEFELKQAMEQRQKAEENGFRQKAALDAMNKDAAESKRIEKQLELDLLLLAERQTNERATLNQKIDETKAKLDALKKSQSPLDLSGGAKGVADAFSSVNDSFKKGAIYSADTPQSKADQAKIDAAKKTLDGLNKAAPKDANPAAPANSIFVPGGAESVTALPVLERILASLERMERAPVKVQVSNGTNASNDSAFQLHRAPGLGEKK